MTLDRLKHLYLRIDDIKKEIDKKKKAEVKKLVYSSIREDFDLEFVNREREREREVIEVRFSFSTNKYSLLKSQISHEW